MITNAHILFLNCCSFEQPNLTFKNGKLDDCSFDFVEKINMDHIKENILTIKLFMMENYRTENFTFSFVDENYRINFYYTQRGKDFFNSLSTFIRDENNNGEVEFNDCKVRDFFETFEMNKNTAYFIASYDSYEHEYHFCNFLNIPLDSNIFTIYRIRNFLEILNSKCNYDLFSAQSIDESLDCFERQRHMNLRAVKNVIKRGIIQLEIFKSTGFLDFSEFIFLKIPAFALNIECEIFSAGVILRYGLIPPKEYYLDGTPYCTNTPQEEFCESSDYRFQLSDIMAQILAKHSQNFGFVREVRDWKKLKLEKLLSFCE